jgi:hypothetical protein
MKFITIGGKQDERRIASHTMRVVRTGLLLVILVASLLPLRLDLRAGTDRLVPFTARAVTATNGAGLAGWSDRYVLTFNNGDTELSDFVTLVRLNTTKIPDLYTKTQPNGDDIRFTTEDGDILPYEINTWNPAGDSLIWVRVPQIKAGTITSIYLYYGKADAPIGQNSTNVWWPEYRAVWHMEPNGAIYPDSSGAGSDATAVGNIGSTTRIGNALVIDDDAATRDYLRLPTNSDASGNPTNGDNSCIVL